MSSSSGKSSSGGGPPGDHKDNRRQERRKSLDEQKEKLATLIKPKKLTEEVSPPPTKSKVKDAVSRALSIIKSSKSTRNIEEETKRSEAEALRKYNNQLFKEKSQAALIAERKKKLAEAELEKKYKNQVEESEKQHQLELTEAKKGNNSKAQSADPNLLENLKQKVSNTKMTVDASKAQIVKDATTPSSAPPSTQSPAPKKTSVPVRRSGQKNNTNAQKRLSNDNKSAAAGIKPPPPTPERKPSIVKSVIPPGLINKDVKETKGDDGLSIKEKPSKTISNMSGGSDQGSEDDELLSKSHHELVTYSTNFDDNVIVGPTASALNYAWFGKRISKITTYMFGIAITLAFETGIIQYATMLLPAESFCRKELIDILNGQGYAFMFNIWLPITAGFIMLFYGVALIQYAKPENWPKFGEWCARIHEEIKEQMVDDFNTAEGERLETSQRYFECCGIESYKDWEVYAVNDDLDWHGELCSKRGIKDGYNNNDTVFTIHSKACKVPMSCWKDNYTDVGNMRIFVHDHNCLFMEVVTAYSIMAFIIFFLLAVIVADLATFIYLHRVIRLANMKKVQLKPKMQFEECF